MVDLTYADSLKEEGNYLRSIKEYKSAISEKAGLREKADINQKIMFAQSCYKSNVNLAFGEVFFPVVNLASSRGIVLIGKVCEGGETNLSEGLNKRWEKIKKITSNFLDKYLYDNIKTIMVLEWGLDHYNFSIKSIPNSTLRIDELADGGSVELGMFISLVSVILNENIQNSFAFTGEVDENYSIGYVNGITEKTEAVKIERKMVKQFLIPSNTNTKVRIQKEVNNLSEVISLVFQNFNEKIRQQHNTLGERRLTLSMSKVKKGNEFIDYADFNFGDRNNIKEEEGEKVYSFLQNNVEKCKSCSNGLVISGLTISYSAPMFVTPLYNYTPKFLAIRYTQAKVNQGEGAAFIILSKVVSSHKPGEMVRFILPEQSKT